MPDTGPQEGAQPTMTEPGNQRGGQGQSRSRLAAWTLRQPWLVTAVAAVVSALGLAAADAVFLGGFGLGLWEVGHTPWGLLLRSPLVLLLLAAGGASGVVVRVSGRQGEAGAEGPARAGRVLLVAAMVLACLLAPGQAVWARDQVRHGHTLWMGPWWPRPFQIAPARVAGVGGYSPPAAVTGSGARLLAASADRYWLYVPVTGETIDVPARQVILMIQAQPAESWRGRSPSSSPQARQR